ncbi:N-6 DNA methylase [Pandoraea sp.]|uniref:N-6 DNA methylase n=1 Tax=Pandoraea sp. TaxID=1883445 RepID=UPI0035B42AD1
MQNDNQNFRSAGMTGAVSQSKHDRERRKALGIYYTPPEAAKWLAGWAIRSPKDTVLEPSFGGCALLSAAVSIFSSLGNATPSAQLYGYDVDPAAFEHLVQMGIDNPDGHFKKQDFLQSTSGAVLVDAVIANPPFVSYHRQTEEQRIVSAKIQQQYLPSLPRMASLWASFLLHSMSFLRPGGRMAFLLPNAIGTADYAKPLLAHIRTRFGKVELVHVTEQMFIQAGAGERISLLLLSDFAPRSLQNPTPIAARNITNIRELVTSVGMLDDDDVVTTTDVRDVAAASLARLHEDVLVELGSKASVQIGEVVGDIRTFVRPLSAWANDGIAHKHLAPLLTRSSQISGIWLPDVQSQHSSANVPYLLLPPTGRLPNAIKQFLSRYSDEEIAENKTFGKRDIWYRCSYERDADAFIGSLSHEYPRIIGNDAGISCSNAFYKISTHRADGLAQWLPILSLTTPLRLAAEVLGRVRGSGGIKLEPSDVRKLSIPHTLPKLPKRELLEARTKLGKLVSAGELEAASQYADALVFLQPGLLDAATMSELRAHRIALNRRRITTRNRAG